MASDLLTGVWTGRAFRNLPRPVEDFNEIRFGQGELFISAASEPCVLRGQLAFRSDPPKSDAGRMALHGSVQAGNPCGGLPARAGPSFGLLLNDEATVTALAARVRQVIDRQALTTFADMPLTRDLSEGKRRLLRWCDRQPRPATPAP